MVDHVDKDAQSSHLEDVERGEVLVNEKVLLSGETKPKQRSILFRTTCKCEGKCCDVIVDGGNIEKLGVKGDGLKAKAQEGETPPTLLDFLGEG